MTAIEGARLRAIIENVKPEVDCGRFPIKRTVAERVVVEADVFTDGHDQIICLLLHRRTEADEWLETPMAPLGNDRWRASFTVGAPGRHCYTVIAWVDRFLTWRHDLARRQDEKDIESALHAGAAIIRDAAGRAGSSDRKMLKRTAGLLTGKEPLETRRQLALEEELKRSMHRHADRQFATAYARELEVVVDRERARFSSWYELFPRSTFDRKKRHGTFRQVEEQLPAIAEMGFNVLYFPPIHPIGEINRKGPNNTLVAGPDDPGCPWAIGSSDGGHTAIHEKLGTTADFRRLLAAAEKLGIDIALDIAFQCAPDHPYVREHPSWFRHRPDGSIQYAENPPKKYEDIYPFDFESDDWQGLWEELRDVVWFWVEEGVRVFRVDNPHTKPFPFWEWLIGDVKARNPDVIFLAEAFTRPKVMHRLAKLGFTQSYTYFTWRNTKHELTEYLTELCGSESREYFRPNLWPNTPDILHEYLQLGGRPAFTARLVLAATMGANYGIYGPAFELLEATPRHPRSEEYLDSEKYQVRQWDLDQPGHLRDLITRVNEIRQENKALHGDWSLAFHEVDNDAIIGYSKVTPDLTNIILTVVNVDPHHRQSGFVQVPIDSWGIPEDQPFQVHDLLSGSHYLWHGRRNYVELDPHLSQAHIFRIRTRIGSEQDFDYFM